MAALQRRANSWRVLFRYQDKQHSYTIGDVDDLEAHPWKANVEFLLMRVDRGVKEGQFRGL